MIPITPKTTLSLEKTAKLAQKLIDLTENQNLELPDDLQGQFENYLNFQYCFVRDIDKYLHQQRHYEDEEHIEVIATIVETCPEFLATEYKYDDVIPCHTAANMATSSAYNHLLTFLDIGLQYSIGGEDSRGGLLRHGSLRCIRDPEVFEAMRNHDPPLFYVEDVQKHGLLCNAASEHSLDLVEYFYNLDPSSLCDPNGYCKAICSATLFSNRNDPERLEVIEYLLQLIASRRNDSDEPLGGLLRNLFSFVFGWREKAWDCIGRAISTNNGLDTLPILPQIILHTPIYCSESIKRFPSIVHVRDTNNGDRLPIHVALEVGMEYSRNFERLITASQEYLKEVDPVTNWTPFVLATMGKTCHLGVLFRLLREYPEQAGEWDWSAGSENIPRENYKRRKVNE